MILKGEKKFPFLGPDDAIQSDWAASRVVILPIPFEKTVSYGGGTAKGPEAILRASAYVETFDEELAFEPSGCGIFTAMSLELEGLSMENVFKEIERAADEIVEAGKFLLGLGGEHSISCGLVRAVHKKYPNLHVVHLDAHADMRQEYGGTMWSHASVMRRIHEMGISHTSVGIRSISHEEHELIKKMRDHYFFAHEIVEDADWIKKVIERVSSPVFVTLDVDVFDGSLLPHTGTPEPGGLTWHQATGFLRELIGSKNVVGADVVELAPTPSSRASDFMVAKLVHKIIGYWWKAQ